MELQAGFVAAVLALAHWRLRQDRRRGPPGLLWWLLLVTTVLLVLAGMLEFAGTEATERWGWLLTSPLAATPLSPGLLANMLALLMIAQASVIFIRRSRQYLSQAPKSR